MESEFIKIRLEGDGLAGAEIIGLSARFIRKLAKVRLRPGNEKESARPVPRIGSIDGPNVDILLLRAADGGIEIHRPIPEISPEIVDAGREEEDGTPVRGSRQALHQIKKSEIGTGEGTSVAERQAQSLGGEFVVVGEILGDHGGAVAGVGHGDICSVRLVEEKGFQIAPLVGDDVVERIVDQDGEVQFVGMLPIGNLGALLV